MLKYDYTDYFIPMLYKAKFILILGLCAGIAGFLFFLEAHRVQAGWSVNQYDDVVIDSITPADGATDVSLTPDFIWTATTNNGAKVISFKIKLFDNSGALLSDSCVITFSPSKSGTFETSASWSCLSTGKLKVNTSYKWQLEVTYELGDICAGQPNCENTGIVPEIGTFWTFTTTPHADAPQTAPTNFTALALDEGQTTPINPSDPNSPLETCTKQKCIFWNWDPVSDADWYQMQNNFYNGTNDYYMETNRACNELRTEDVQACNPNGCGPFTLSPISIYTLACLPTSCWVANTTENSITWAWDNGGNPVGTSFLATATTTPDNVSSCVPPLNGGTGCEVANSGWSTATTFTASGLNCGTTYWASVKARNGDLVESDYFFCDPGVTLACPLPDLAVGVITPPSAGQCSGTNYDITAEIANNGGADAGAFDVKFTVTNNEGLSVDVCTINVASLAAGGKTTLTCSVDCLANPLSAACASGSKTVTVTADSASVVAEEDETNNTSTSSYTLDSAPGAVVNLRETSVSATSITWDWSPDLQATAPTSYNVYIDGVLDSVATVSGYTKSGLSCSTAHTIEIVPVNACGSGPGATDSASTSACADLVCSNLSSSPEPVCAGASLTLSADVSNQGGSSSGSSVTKLSAGTISCSVNTPGLAPGAASAASCAVTAPSAVGV